MDLVQAEAVGDLVDARSGAMQRAALGQLDGGLSRRVNELREALLDVEALLAYDIDFPEEDDGPVAPERVTAAARGVLARLDALLATAPAGTLVRDGAAVVIAGAPNAGKSSLFNALLGERRAIVTEVPGTTRDAIEAVLDAHPFPLRLVDTAGLRSTEDVVERLGIEVSEGWLARAEVVLACGERAAEVASTVARARALTAAPVLGVWTKRDGEAAEEGAGARGAPPTGNLAPGAPIAVTETPSTASDRRTVAAPLEVSAHTGAGLGALLDAVQRTLVEHHALPPAGDIPLVTRARHRRALAEAHDEVALFLDAWSAGALPAPVAAVHVRAAAGALESLIGAVDVEEVLGRVFGEFCVGK
jgi:tRNA modification GTPase